MYLKQIRNFYLKYKPEIIVSLVFLFFAFAYNTYRVVGDGLLYYGILEKTLPIPDPESSSTYLQAGFMQCGNAFFNIPFYLGAYFVEKIFHLKVNFDGITLRTASITIASNFYLLLSLILCVRILKKLRLKNIILPCLCILFSTSGYAVATIMPSWNHSVDIFVNTVFIYYFLSLEINPSRKKSIILGITYIISILVRYFNFILIAPILLYLLYKKDFKNFKTILTTILLSFWIIPLIFYIYNGNPFMPFSNSGLSSDISQHVLHYPAYMLHYLVHPIHGLFVWAPVIILSIIGLYFAPKNIEKLNFVFLGIFILLLFINGLNPEWHGGWSFTNRYLVSLFAIYIIGLSAFLELKSRYYIFLPVLFTGYSVFLFFNWLFVTSDGQYGSIIDIYRYWSTGYAAKLGALTEKIMVACRYKYLIKLITK